MQHQVVEFSEEERVRQKEEFGDLLMDEPSLKEGQTWFLIATRWYNQWEEFIGLSTYRGPGPNPVKHNNQTKKFFFFFSQKI